jgi:hypothetical protein
MGPTSMFYYRFQHLFSELVPCLPIAILLVLHLRLSQCSLFYVYVRRNYSFIYAVTCNNHVPLSTSFTVSCPGRVAEVFTT